MTTWFMSRLSDSGTEVEHCVLSTGMLGPVCWIKITTASCLGKDPRGVHDQWVAQIVPTL